MQATAQAAKAASVSPGSDEPQRGAANRISSLILFVTVALAPLPFGSTDATTVVFWCLALGAALVMSTPRGLNLRQFGVLALAGIVVAAYGIVLHEQVSTRPWLAVAVPHPIWRKASEALGTNLEPSVSIARDRPLYALGPPLAAMLALICSFVVCAAREKARRLLLVVAWSGVAYAVLGIASYLIDPTKILWRDKQAYLTVLTGTFINRNTAAAYFGACSVVWLLFLCEQARQRLPSGEIRWRAVPDQLFTKMPRYIVLSFSMLFVCLAAMFMTGSRAGVVVSLMAAVMAFTLYFRRDLPRKTGVIATLVVASAIALLLLQVMGAGVSGRFDIQSVIDGGRLDTYRSTLRMIADHPWFGTGLGTFASAYPAYRSSNVSMWGVWDRAHNTLLEIAAEGGVPLALVVVAAWLVALAILIHGLRTRRRDLILPIAAIAVGTIAVVHSLVDFSLQIPGLAIVAFAVVGAGLAQSTRASAPDRSHARAEATLF